MPGTPISGLPSWTNEGGGDGGTLASSQLSIVSHSDTVTVPDNAYRTNLKELDEWTLGQHRKTKQRSSGLYPPLAVLRLSIPALPTKYATIIGGNPQQNQYIADMMPLFSTVSTVPPGNPSSQVLVNKAGTQLEFQEEFFDGTWNNKPWQWYPPYLSLRNDQDSTAVFGIDGSGDLQYKPLFIKAIPNALTIHYYVNGAVNVPPVGWTEIAFTATLLNELHLGELGTAVNIVKPGLYSVNFRLYVGPVPYLGNAHLSVIGVVMDAWNATVETFQWIDYCDQNTIGKVFNPVINSIINVPAFRKIKFYSIQNGTVSGVPVTGFTSFSHPYPALEICRIGAPLE